MDIAKPTILDRIGRLLEEARRRARTWGQIQIDLQNGEPTLLRHSITEKLPQNGEQPRYESFNQDRRR